MLPLRLLDVVVGESAAILQLLAREDEALLVGFQARRVVVSWNLASTAWMVSEDSTMRVILLNDTTACLAKVGILFG